MKKKRKKQRNHREYVLSLRPYYYYYYYFGLYRASGLFSNRPQQQQQKADEKVRLVVCLQCPTRRIRYRRITRFSSAHPLRERKRRGRCVGSTFKHVRRAPLYPFPSPSLSSFLLPFLYFFLQQQQQQGVYTQRRKRGTSTCLCSLLFRACLRCDDFVPVTNAARVWLGPRHPALYPTNPLCVVLPRPGRSGVAGECAECAWGVPKFGAGASLSGVVRHGPMLRAGVRAARADG